jgi:hypothetical protein
MALLKQIQAFFGVGILFVRKNGKVVYSVQSYNDLINSEGEENFIFHPLSHHAIFFF